MLYLEENEWPCSEKFIFLQYNNLGNETPLQRARTREVASPSATTSWEKAAGMCQQD